VHQQHAGWEKTLINAVLHMVRQLKSPWNDNHAVHLGIGMDMDCCRLGLQAWCALIATQKP
jgi:hypothetical protein